MNPMEIITYIGQDGNHFMGAVIILGVMFSGIAKIIHAIRGTRVAEEDED